MDSRAIFRMDMGFYKFPSREVHIIDVLGALGEADGSFQKSGALKKSACGIEKNDDCAAFCM